MYDFTLIINGYQYDAQVDYEYHRRISGDRDTPVEPEHIELGKVTVLFDGEPVEFYLPGEVADEIELEILAEYQ